jgi:membrane-bound lytic murein transglycosylase D
MKQNSSFRIGNRIRSVSALTMDLALALILTLPLVLATPSLASGDEDEESIDEEELPALMQGTARGGTSAFMTSFGLLSTKELENATPWTAPDYSGQNGVLGWSDSVFEVPAGLKYRVAFWREIYSKLSTNQGLIHDSVYPEVVYETIDFNYIRHNTKLNAFQMEKQREELISKRKKEIANQLVRLNSWLHQKKTEKGLSPADLRVWHLFEKIRNPNKFLAAAAKKRIRFQLGQKDRFMLGIYYSGQYLSSMEAIFRNQRLPIELTRLPFVESSFNVNARSKVGASGIWQIMPRTGRGLLKINKVIDERNDPLVATLAAAKILKQNYSMLRSWPLALTAYNHGSYGVHLAAQKVGSRNIETIVEKYSSKQFGFASKNFYACFLAALIVERDARKYFGDVKWSSKIQFAGSSQNSTLGLNSTRRRLEKLHTPSAVSAYLSGRARPVYSNGK